jgi:hypothetical protein
MILAIAAIPAMAATVLHSQAAEKQQVVLVELFTSEGCSSCPPADALLRQVNGTKTSAGQLIVGISEHVTYWNSLGWADPFSSSIYTDRQNAYGQHFGLDSVYTPQMIVNGTEQFVGSDQARLTRALQRQSKPQPITLRILSMQTKGSTLSVSFSASGEVPAHGADIIAVLADDADRSSVLRGENSGRTLAHVAVARSLTRVATLNAAKEQTVQIPLPPSFQGTQGHHLVLFAQAQGHGRVLGADTKPL